MKIALLSINISYVHTNLALPLIRGFAESAISAEWKEFAGTLKDDIQKDLKALNDYAPDLLLTTLYMFNRGSLLALLKDFKKLRPDCIIIAGGPEFLGNNKKFLIENSFVNVVVRGEGEKPIKKLLKTFSVGINLPKTLSNILGFCFLDRESKYIDNSVAEIVKNIDKIPSVYMQKDFVFKKPFYQIETSRGCPGKCTFCTSSLSNKMRYHSFGYIISEINKLKNCGVRNIRLLDRTFNYPAERAVQLLKIFRENFPEILFHLEIEPGLLTDELKIELSKAPLGHLHLEVGIQSLKPDTLKKIKRISSAEKVFAGINWLSQQKNIVLHSDLIIGLPKTDINSLCNDLRKLILLSIDEIQIERLKLLPGTSLREKAEEENISFAETTPYEILRTPQMPSKDLLLADTIMNFCDLFYNFAPLQEVIGLIVREHNNFILSFAKYLHKRDIKGISPDLRFQFLVDFLREKGIYSERFFLQLLYSWVKAGYSPKKNSFGNARYKGKIPKKTKFIFGEKLSSKIQKRVYVTVFGGKNYYILLAHPNGHKPNVEILNFI
ncbi:MAG: B12-binding domain-containing radical SAM protein [Verrucomicrobiota bacterium]|nr:B12-binding domain-containing radical SAM protein [Verrucomicrobiota bacterium]